MHGEQMQATTFIPKRGNRRSITRQLPHHQSKRCAKNDLIRRQSSCSKYVMHLPVHSACTGQPSTSLPIDARFRPKEWRHNSGQPSQDMNRRFFCFPDKSDRADDWLNHPFLGTILSKGIQQLGPCNMYATHRKSGRSKTGVCIFTRLNEKA